MSEKAFALRPGRLDDRSFILASWLQNYRRESHFARRITDTVFYANHHDVADALLRRCRVTVATLKNDDAEILGYLVWEAPAEGRPHVLHWCYVKKPFRRMGVGRALVEATGAPKDLDGCYITHATMLWFAARRAEGYSPGLEAMFPKVIYNPYLALREPEEQPWQK
jgi:GNAT superfamily N-acetyltransferase